MEITKYTLLSVGFYLHPITVYIWGNFLLVVPLLQQQKIKASMQMVAYIAASRVTPLR